MLAGLGDDAEMEFRGVPAGPYVGKDAIRAAYGARRPDDELRVLESRERPDGVDARYAWLSEPDVAAGELLLTVRDGRISRVVVTFERDVSWV
jgi:hypothetical protein